MTDARSIEGRISSWMEEREAGTHYPDRLLNATFEQTRELRQARSIRPSAFRSVRSRMSVVAAGGAAVVLVVVGALGLGSVVNPVASPTPPPSPTVPASPFAEASSPPGYMWPQSTLEEVRAAQELADAGDPAYTWQVDRDLGGPGNLDSNHPGPGGDDAAIFGRFLEEELGWEEYLWTESFAHPRSLGGLQEGEVVYIRCAPGQTNPLYPADPKGSACAPTIDDLQYETARIRVAQLDHQGGSGIWVVTRWVIEPAVQVDPRVEEAQAREFLESFLQARIDGDGAEELVPDYADVPEDGANQEVPLLYATSTGAPYQRYEVEPGDGPRWPRGDMQFDVRLFAANDETVVEQRFSLPPDDTGRRHVDYDREHATWENGEAVPVEYRFLGGELTLRVAAPLTANADDFRDVVIEGLVPDDFSLLLMLADPTPFGPGCEETQAPTNAAEVAQTIRSNPKFEAMAPVDVTIGGLPALRVDAVLKPRAGTCAWPEGDITEFGPLMRYARFEMEDRARLYLIDLPEGSQAQVLAIVTIADEDSLEIALAAAAPILESIEFHAP